MGKSYELAELGQSLTYDISSNVTTIQTDLSIGNSTVDVVINSTAIALGNSTVNTNIGDLTMSFADTTSNYSVNTSTISFSNPLGTYFSNTSSIAFGNSTTNVAINSTAVFVNGGRLTGTNLSSTYAWLNNHTYSITTPSTNAVSGALQITGGIGVYGNIYTGGVIGISNSANVSVVYQYYNLTTDSLDTVFG